MMGKQRLAERLEAYLEPLYLDRSGISVTGLSEINAGWETELYTLEVHSILNGEQVNEKRVLRVFQGDDAGRKSAKEYHLMRRLYAVGYPVPKVYGHEPSGRIIGKPFMLMEWIIGNTLDAAYRNETPEERRRGVDRLMALFAQLHRLDVAPFKGIPELPCHDDLVQDSLDWYKSAAEGQLQWMSPVVDWLTQRKRCIDSAPQSLVHMDFHGMNVLLREDGSEAVIDWGASRIGDLRMDLGWTLLLYTTFSGEAYREPLLASYSEHSGEEVEDIEYFEVMAAARRIIDFATTMKGGADSVGLKPEVVDMMKASKEHYRRVHNLLTARTGIQLDTFAETLDSI
jgi:aminoglycoside phosphotransferase (APT) family kinase protein